MVPELQRVKRLFKDLQKAKLITFPEKPGDLEATTHQGVYIIYTPNGKPAHVGRTYRGKNGLRQRLTNHLHTQSSFVKNYKPLKNDGSKLRNSYCYQYLTLGEPRERALLEAYAVGQLCPEYIGVRNDKRETTRNSESK